MGESNGTSLAQATASAVSGLSASFMLDGNTYKRGAELGFGGIDFYFAGRAGALGDVGADVVTSALAFFSPAVVEPAWNNSRSVMSRADSAAEFGGCLARWAADHLGDDVDWARLAELCREVATSATVAAAPLFAAWRAMPAADEPRAIALHEMNLIRELRMARHAAAVIALGIDPSDAVRHRSPGMCGIFGWDATAVPEGVADVWIEAEALTNRALDHDLRVLSDEQQGEFAALTAAAVASVH